MERDKNPGAGHPIQAGSYARTRAHAQERGRVPMGARARRRSRHPPPTGKKFSGHPSKTPCSLVCEKNSDLGDLGIEPQEQPQTMGRRAH